MYWRQQKGAKYTQAHTPDKDIFLRGQLFSTLFTEPQVGLCTEMLWVCFEKEVEKEIKFEKRKSYGCLILSEDYAREAVEVK